MRTSIILFLNKVDLFKQKLSRSPLSSYFPDYSGGNDVNRAAKYLLWRFNQVNRAHLNLYPQYVTMTRFPCIPIIALTDYQKSHTSHRYFKYPSRFRRSQRNDSP
jgi:guanine nucleotide-binding protein subunit alpha